MQLLYGNDGNNYRTLARTADMDELIEKELKEAYLNYRFVVRDSLYSSVKFQPVSITYATTNLGNILKEEQILICKNARMSNYKTPSSYAHFIIQPDDGTRYGRSFYDLLRYSFVSDVEAGTYTDDMLEQFMPILGEEPKEAGLPEEILKVLVGVIFLKDKRTSQVRIILDQDGDRYNSRCLEVIQAVYRYLPWDLKRRFGFCTYAVPGQNVAGRVKFILMPSSAQGGQANADVISLNDPKLPELYRSFNDEIKTYVEYLFAMSDDEREDYFESIARIMNGKSLSLADYINLYKTTSRWDKEPLESIFQEWLEFAWKNIKSKSPVMGVFKAIVTNRLTQDIWDSYIQACLEQQSGHVNEWNQHLKQMILFSDMFDSLALAEEAFTGWLEECVMKPLHHTYQGYEFIAKAEDEKASIMACDIKSQKFHKVKKEMMALIDQNISSEQAWLEEQIRLEKEKISYMVSEHDVADPKELNQLIKDIRLQLKYPDDTMANLTAAWEEGMGMLLNRIRSFYSEEEMRLYDTAIQEGIEIAEVKDAGAIWKLAKEKRWWLNSLAEKRVFILNDEESVIAANMQIKGLDRLLSSAPRRPFSEVEVYIGTELYHMEIPDLEQLLRFLKEPAWMNDRGVRMKLEEGMLKSLLRSECLKRQHLSYLIEIRPDMATVILKKFYKSERLRPHDHIGVSNCIKKYLTDEQIKYLVHQLQIAEWKGYEQKNLLAMLGGNKDSMSDSARVSKPDYLTAFFIGGLSLLLCGCLAAVNFLILSAMMDMIFVVMFYTIDILLFILLLLGTVCFVFDY